MKKIFKLFIAVIALSSAMVFKPVSAETNTAGILTVEKNIVVPTGTTLGNTTWTVNVVPATVTANAKVDGYDLYAGIALENANATITVTGGTAQNLTDANGTAFYGYKGSTTIDFNDVEFTAAGVYRYTVTETANANNTAVTYDSSVYTIDVYVTYDAANELIPSYIICRDVNDDKTPLQFTNTVTTGAYHLQKEVTGNLGDKSKEFEFSVYVTASTLMPNLTVVNGYIAHTDGTVTAVEVTVGSAFTAKLKHGEQLVIPSLPVGTTISTAETSANTAGYTTTSVNMITNVESTTALTFTDAMTANGLSYKYINDKDADLPDTGIRESSTLLMLAAGVVGAGALLFVLTKKHSDEE